MLSFRKLLVAIGLIAWALGAQAADLAVLLNGFSIRHERREVIGGTTRLYVDSRSDNYVDVATGEIDHFEKDLTSQQGSGKSSKTTNLSDIVKDVSSNYRLDPDLVNSVIHAESGFNTRAVSPKGAQGLMQLMPETASKLGIENAFDPEANVDGGSRYLRALIEHYHFDLVKALAAYNAGPDRVQQYGGVPPYSETRAYVARIVNDYNRKKLAEQKVVTRKPASRLSKNLSTTANIRSHLAIVASKSN